MTQSEAIAFAHKAVADAEAKMLRSYARQSNGDDGAAAYMLARAAILRLRVHRGAERAAEAVYALADECVGAQQ